MREESHWREDPVFDRDERRFTVRFRRSLGGLAEPGNSGMAADLRRYHRPTQRVGRRNTHSNACHSADRNPRSGEAGKEVLRPFPPEDMKIRPVSTRINKPENNDPGLLEEGEMEQVGRLI